MLWSKLTKKSKIVQKNSGGGTNCSLTKRLLSFALSAVMLIVMAGYMPETQVNAAPAVWGGGYNVDWYDGEMREIHISTAAQLAGLAKLVNSGKTMSGQTIILDSDIILNDISNYDNWSSKAPANNWTPIGHGDDSLSYNFRGTFDGGGHTITGLYIYISNNESSVYSGLFGGIYGGTIKNVSCEYSYVYANSQYRYYNRYSGSYENGAEVYSGGICGNSSRGTISNCINKGYVYSRNYYTSYNVNEYFSAYAGGICGYAYGGSIENCYNQGKVNGYYSGGISGFFAINSYNNEGEISNVYNTGGISSGKYAGAILGGSGYLPDMTACYYLTSSAEKGIGKSDSSDSYISGKTIGKNNAGMQSEEFVKSLGDAFVYNPGGYPKLAWELNNISARFDKENVTLNKSGETAALKLYTSYSGTPIWISSDTNVATVENGVVTAVANGTATIYAICGDVQATCTVKVDLSTDFSLNYDTVTMGVGETFTLKTLNYNGTCTWLSSDTRIAKISSDGVITAVASGETVIYAILSNGKTLSCNVSITEKTVTIADVVLLQKFLAKQLSVVPATADCNGDGKINVFDLIILKRLIINQN